MKQRSFYRVRFYAEVGDNELENVLNGICQDGGTINNVDIHHHRKELRVVMEYNEKEYNELKNKERNNTSPEHYFR